MSKNELIEAICRLNPTARKEFLATFREQDLVAYLKQLQEVARSAPAPDPVFVMAG